MGRSNYLQNNFTAGELSPRLSLRSDLVRYKNGLKTLLNGLVLPFGGVTRRTGTKMVAEVKDSSSETRLIEFQFSKDTSQNYIIEFGGSYIRFFKDGEQIREAAKTITGATQADPVVVTTSAAHGYSNGDAVYIDSVGGMTELNRPTSEYRVANVTATTFELQNIDGTDIDGTGFTAYTSGGNVQKVYEISSPYSASEVMDIQYRQSADIIYLVHRDYTERQLTRTGDTAWTLTLTDFIDGPYLDQNVTATTLTPSATSGTITFTASATTGINGGDGFKSTDVTRYFRFQDAASTWHWIQITNFTSTTSVDGTIEGSTSPLSSTAARTQWMLGAWSDTTGWPSSTTSYENRAIYAATNEQPDTVWGSALDGYQDFTPGTAADDPFAFTLASAQLNEIKWLVPRDALRIGTTGAEWEMFGDANTVITPTNVTANASTYIGSSSVLPVNAGQATLYWQRSNKRLRELLFNFEADGLIGNDISILSEHLTRGGVETMTYQAEPHGIIWIAKTNGDLLGLTYLKEQEVIGWHLHQLGGTDTKVKSLATVPISGQDRTWMIVERTINGSTRKFVEYLDDTFIDKNIKQANFVDSFITYSGDTPAANLTLSATTGTGITITASASVFAAGDVDKHIRTSAGKLVITGYTSGTVVTGNVAVDFTSTSITSGDWTLSSDTIEGLHHLEGETVSLLADGGTHPTETVTDGKITMDRQGTDVVVGLGYTTDVESLDLDTASQLGTAQGNKARITDITVDMFESVGLKLGSDSDSLREIDFRIPSDPMGEGLPLFTGFKQVRPNHKWKRGATIFMRQSQPLPMTILGYTAKVTVSDAS
jgi:hypothetical protein